MTDHHPLVAIISLWGWGEVILGDSIISNVKGVACEGVFDFMVTSLLNAKIADITQLGRSQQSSKRLLAPLTLGNVIVSSCRGKNVGFQAKC